MTAGTDDKIHINEVKSHSFSANAIAATGMPTGIVASPKDSDLSIFTVAQGHVIVLRKDHVASKIDVKYRPNSLAISPDGTEIAVAGDVSSSDLLVVLLLFVNHNFSSLL